MTFYTKWQYYLKIHHSSQNHTSFQAHTEPNTKHIWTSKTQIHNQITAIKQELVWFAPRTSSGQSTINEHLPVVFPLVSSPYRWLHVWPMVVWKPKPTKTISVALTSLCSLSVVATGHPFKEIRTISPLLKGHCLLPPWVTREAEFLPGKILEVL